MPPSTFVYDLEPILCSTARPEGLSALALPVAP